MAFRTIKHAQHWLGRRGPVELVVGAAAVYLVADHLLAPKGMSYVSKLTAKVSGSSLGRKIAAIPPPGHATGANNQAGWNRGMSPYGGWALNAPAGPWPYAHAGSQRHGDYESYGNYNNYGNYGWSP